MSGELDPGNFWTVIVKIAISFFRSPFWRSFRSCWTKIKMVCVIFQEISVLILNCAGFMLKKTKPVESVLVRVQDAVDILFIPVTYFRWTYQNSAGLTAKSANATRPTRCLSTKSQRKDMLPRVEGVTTANSRVMVVNPSLSSRKR